MLFRSIVPEKSKISLTKIISLPVHEWKHKVVNQFEPSVFQQYPEIGAIKQQLYSMGAVYASMSGSGSSVFGLFSKLPVSWKSKFPNDYLTYSQQL